MNDHEIRHKIRNWLTIENVTGFIHHVFINCEILQNDIIIRIMRCILKKITYYEYFSVYDFAYMKFYSAIFLPCVFNCSLSQLHNALSLYKPYADYVPNNLIQPWVTLNCGKRCHNVEHFSKYDARVFFHFFNLQNIRLIFYEWFNNYHIPRGNFEITFKLFLNYRSFRKKDNLYCRFYKYIQKNMTSQSIHSMFIYFDCYRRFVYRFQLQNALLPIYQNIFNNYEPTNIVHRLLSNEYIMQKVINY